MPEQSIACWAGAFRSLLARLAMILAAAAPLVFAACSAKSESSPAVLIDNQTIAPHTTTAPVPTPAPTPTLALATPLDPTYELAPVDKNVGMPDGFAPPDLVSVPDGYAYKTGLLLRAAVLPTLETMIDTGKTANVYLQALSCYRSYQDQQSVWASVAATEGQAKAAEEVAPPGHSEHQLGTTCDFTDAGNLNPLQQTWSNTQAGDWVTAHGWEYGWVMSYPQGKEQVTGYAYEPWHFRYIGVENALLWHGSGLTLVEFLRLLQQGAPIPTLASGQTAAP